MGKLEKIMFMLSIPMPRARIRLEERLPQTEPVGSPCAAALAMVLGSLAGKKFATPQKALSWANKKKLLPPSQAQPSLTWGEAAYMLFSFSRAVGVNVALPRATRLFDVAPVQALPQWSLTAAQWSLSAGLILPPVDFSQKLTLSELSALFAAYGKALADARQRPQREYKLQLFGDSITDCSWGDCTTWTGFFPARLGDAKLSLVNNAYGGGMLTAVPRRKNCVVGLLPRMLHPDSDLVVVFAGTNDFAVDTVELGDPEDITPRTVWGAVKEISQAVGSRPLLFVGPAPRYNQQDRLRPKNDRGELCNALGWTLGQGNRALRDGAHACGREYVDLYDDPVFRHEELAYATIDGLHPNALGDILLAARLYGKIQQCLGG